MNNLFVKEKWIQVSRITGIFCLVLLLAIPVLAQEWYENPESCTSIMVGKKASTDGSVITCQTCDGNYRTWLNIVPHQTYDTGSKKQIYWGNLHTETPWDSRGRILKGEIPQAEETYSYLNVAYPCLNEKQLAMGETTIGGRGELRNDDGIFLIEELQSIVLERCTTAREALKIIGELVKEYGYGDWGECLTFADPNEVWHFEIFGSGPMEVGAVWAAQRIPDDHVGISANIPRIGELDLDNEDFYMASDNVYTLAEEMGWWDPESGETFKFWKAYSGRKPFSDREFFFLNSIAPGLKLNRDMDALPFSVKPEKKMSPRDVIAMYRQTYEGTDYDMTQNLMVPELRRRRRGQQPDETPPKIVKSPVANPWMNRETMNLLNTLKPGTVERRRTIAIAACSYSQIVQVRDWLPDGIGGVAWFSFDNPGQSPRIPIFAGNLELPNSFEFCGQHRYRTDSACWYFRRANRLAHVAHGATRETIENNVMAFEEKAFTELPDIEKKALELFKSEKGEENPMKYREFLTKYTNDFARATMNTWWELGDKFWTWFARGF